MTPSNQRRLYLVRHGASQANLARPYRLQGCGVDLPLCELGRQQSQATSRLLRQAPIRWIFSSHLQRARQTAEIIAAPHALCVHSVAQLRECDVGRWEGLSWEEIGRRDPQYSARFRADPGSVAYPEGESFGDLKARVVPAVDKILADHPQGDLLIVWHAAVGQVYLGHLLEIPPARARQIHLDNGGVSVVKLNAASLAELLMINSALHLDQLADTAAARPADQ